MPRRYCVLDVFSETALSGNPLAVVLDAEGLDAERMQAIAGEFNLSETVFVLPPENPVHSARIRIFTPRRELPFAGHPTIGTAVLLGSRRFGDDGTSDERDAVVVLEEGVGPVRCGVELRGASGYGLMDAPRIPEEGASPGPAEAIAAALGVRPEEIGFEHHLPSCYSAGVPFVFVPLRNLAAVAAASPVRAHWAAAFGGAAAGVFCYTRETVVVGRQFHARMFDSGLGIGEDPATGSAAAAFAGVVHRFEAMPMGTRRMVIEQGFEMGRPSLIGLEVDVEADGLAAVRVGGHAVIVGEGMLHL